MRNICGRQGLLPSTFLIPPCYNQSDTPLYKAGYADVWMGQYHGRGAAVKVLRGYSTSDFDGLTNVSYYWFSRPKYLLTS